MNTKSIKYILPIVLACSVFFSCKKFVEIDPPRTDLIKSTVFNNDATALAALNGLYAQLNSSGVSNGSIFSISFTLALASDVMINFNTSSAKADLDQFNNNTLLSTNNIINNDWTAFYELIYKANSILEGIAASNGLTTPAKNEIEGEAKFIRAFSYFYLVNMFGDVPLVLSTDYITNSNVGRSPSSEVYTQIVNDLKDAQGLLPSDYSGFNNQRVRANKWVATALLARVYLYLEQWQNAEAEATSIINNTSLFTLQSNLSLVFRNTSSEAIFQIWSKNYPLDVNTYYLSGAGGLRDEFMNDFETNDQRKAVWTFAFGGRNYMLKYTDFSNPPKDFSTVIRLAEIYLIRSEARVKQDKVTGINSAESDINIIRNRAGLPATTASTKQNMLLAIEQEREHELFNEWGHRWFDLKRTGRLNSVLSPIKVGWSDYKSLFPIPQVQIDRDPSMANSQNPGY